MNLLTVVEDSGYFTITYRRAKAASDVTITAEVKTELTDAWTTNVQPPVVTDDGNGTTETVLVRDTVPMHGLPHRFMRLGAASL